MKYCQSWYLKISVSASDNRIFGLNILATESDKTSGQSGYFKILQLSRVIHTESIFCEFLHPSLIKYLFAG